MNRFKMIGKDINSNFSNYRNWNTVTSPDLTGDLYAGLKSGKNKLEDIVTHLVLDDSLYINYLMPKPLEWENISNLLPKSLYGSQLAILNDGYAYMFGGHDAYFILKTPLSNPDQWEVDGYLPISSNSGLGGSSFARFDGYIYLFGGKDGYTGTKSVFRAPENEPTNWTEYINVLPDNIYNSHVYVDDGYVYLFGGVNSSGVTDKIYYADRFSPLTTWLQLGTLPYKVAGGNLIVSNTNLYLLGGVDKDFKQINTIVKGSLLDLFTTWSIHSTILPKKSAFMQSCRIGNKFYFFGGENSSQDVMFSNEDFTSWTIINNCLPGPIVNSQLAIIDDRIYLFGGNGSTVINVCKQDLNFKPFDTEYQNYGIIPAILPFYSDPVVEWIILGFPSWRTNYL